MRQFLVSSTYKDLSNANWFKEYIDQESLGMVKNFEHRGHPFRMYAKISEKAIFLTPWYAHVRMRIKEYEMLVFRKVLRTYSINKWLHSPL